MHTTTLHTNTKDHCDQNEVQRSGRHPHPVHDPRGAKHRYYHPACMYSAIMSGDHVVGGGEGGDGGGSGSVVVVLLLLVVVGW